MNESAEPQASPFERAALTKKSSYANRFLNKDEFLHKLFQLNIVCTFYAVSRTYSSYESGPDLAAQKQLLGQRHDPSMFGVQCAKFDVAESTGGPGSLVEKSSKIKNWAECMTPTTHTPPSG